MKDPTERIRSYCLAKPGVFEDHPWDDTVWKVGGKMFATWSAEHKCASLASTVEKQTALIQHPAISVAAYVGRYGWITVKIEDETTLDLAIDLIDESYDQVVSRLPKSARPAP